MFALLIAQFTTAVLLPAIEVGTPLETVISVHFSIGLVIALVMALRLLRRLLRPVPVAPLAAPPWQRNTARAVHLMFYAILLVGPVLGWASASAHGIPVMLLGLFELPALAPLKADWGLVAGDVHGFGMWALMALIAIHSGTALFHHFVRRDDVLSRMLPGDVGRSRSRTQG